MRLKALTIPVWPHEQSNKSNLLFVYYFVWVAPENHVTKITISRHHLQYLQAGLVQKLLLSQSVDDDCLFWSSLLISLQYFLEGYAKGRGRDSGD